MYVNFLHCCCPSSFQGAPLFWVVPPSWPLAMSHPDEPCKQAVSTHLSLQCWRPPPHNSDVGPALIVHSNCRCWKLETISPHPPPNLTSALSPTILVPPPPTMRYYHLLTVSEPRFSSTHPKILTTSIRDQDRKCSVLVGVADIRLLYQQWKTD